LNLKKLLASTCRQKILEALSKPGGMNIMAVVRKINSTYNETNRNLKILEQEGIIHSEVYGRVRYIKLNRENPRTTLLLQALKTLESENKSQMP
jgi:Predicted transcriptional regulator